MRYTFDGSVSDDGSWGLRAHVPNGQTVTKGDLVRVLLFAAAQLEADRDARLPTASEEAAMEADRALPDGWADTGDGTSVIVTLGEGQAHTRNYRRDDMAADAYVTAPCAPDGSTTAGTRQALVAYDRDNPRSEAV